MGKTSVKAIEARLASRGASSVVCTWNVDEYREAARCLVGPSDVVLEIGCCGGMTTSVIHEQCRYVVGVDKNEGEIENARRRFGDLSDRIRFEVADAFDIGKALQMQRQVPGGKFNVVFIDINGSRSLSTVWEVMQAYEKTIMPETIIVKSVHLNTLLLRSTAFQSEATKRMIHRLKANNSKVRSPVVIVVGLGLGCLAAAFSYLRQP